VHDDNPTLFDWAEQASAQKVYLAHKIELKPDREQAIYFAKACGVARFAWNWALAEWNSQYERGEKTSWPELAAQLNSIKLQQFPWMAEIPRRVPAEAVKNLGKAFHRFFSKNAKRPKFKKKGVYDSATLAVSEAEFRVDGKRIRLPLIGWVRMTQTLRFGGTLKRATLSHVAGRWFVSILVEVPWATPSRENQASVGVDLGISAMATTSDGMKYLNPMPLRKNLKRLKRLSRRLSRKQKGSKNREKAKTKLANLHYRIGCIRKDSLHKATTEIVKKYTLIGIEDLNVQGMTANHCLARAINDVGMFEFRRQLTYKAKLYGSEIVVANRFFPSSKMCSDCGFKNESLTLKDREWPCSACGVHHDRDINAARNLNPNNTARYVEINACGDRSSAFVPLTDAKPVDKAGIQRLGNE
jgi:putative transposase